jgi:hypothetical protein
MLENKKSSHKVELAAQMADQFFMTRLKRPQEEGEMAPQVAAGPRGSAAHAARNAPSVQVAQGEAETEGEPSGPVSDDSNPPVGFTPRGSYVDVRA